MNVLELILSEKPIRTPLGFGIHSNIRLTKIDNEVRKYEGEVIRKNTYLTFTKYNNDNKSVSRSEFSYWNLEPENADRIIDNLTTQISQLMNLIAVTNPGKEEDYDPVSGYDSMDDLLSLLSTKKGCNEIMEKMYEGFEKLVKLGENSPLLRLKVVTDRNNKRLQLSRDATIAEPMSVKDTLLKMSDYELKNSQKIAVTSIKPDNASSEAPKKKIIDL
jgi:hypothetical protein